MNPLFKPAPTDVLAAGSARLPSPWAHAMHQLVFNAFLVCFALVWMTLTPGHSFAEEWHGLEGLFWLLAAATSLVGLARCLPGQNVLMASTLLAAISFAVAALAQKTGILFGPRTYTGTFGAKILGVPWPVPLLWLTIIFNGRGVARLIMRPWRETPYYGFRVIGLTGALAVAFDAALEPFATRVKHYWFWELHASVPAWYSAPWMNFLGWFVTTLGILGFTTPWLIDKRPLQQPTDYHPLALWLLLNFYIATANALWQMWPAVVFSRALRGRKRHPGDNDEARMTNAKGNPQSK